MIINSASNNSLPWLLRGHVIKSKSSIGKKKQTIQEYMTCAISLKLNLEPIFHKPLFPFLIDIYNTINRLNQYCPYICLHPLQTDTSSILILLLSSAKNDQ